MQIEIYNPAQGNPLPEIRWNYPELKKWVEDGLEDYRGVVYTEDCINQAKKDRATLNKLAAAIDTKRREMKALYLQPYERFEREAKELTGMIKTVGSEIDAQVKAFDEYRREEKLKKVQGLYADMIGNLAELVPYDRLHNPRWLNVTTSTSAIAEEMGRIIDRITSGLASIDTLKLDKDMDAQVKGVFLQHFDLAEALAARERIEKQREDLERLKTAQEAAQAAKRDDAVTTPQEIKKPSFERVEPVSYSGVAHDEEENVYTVTFRIRVTAEKMKLLGDFMRANGIRPERV